MPTMNPGNEDTAYTVVYMVPWNGRQYYKRMAFATSAHWSQWLHRADEIKGIIARINEDYPGAETTPLTPEKLHRLDNWVLLISNFAADYGVHRVPFDIRHAMHDVQGLLSLPFMDFGPDTGGSFEL